ncbi:DUF3108 domain-containing protein [Marinobacterium sediminicola]|uniref:DUF3108 domain-containing protein n=1 Tax=Marinobacterium sediminicola TaxID=518898 RepID=A0ABY1RW99_9GAMM|nr:DUF3108 domain-containing protein [Marinobacterium sediminicola]ULG70393.1 DUF3108 domain-containing protein [Marinobacterium sediminicola]SMR69510.1 Protein of unknown function [Marinobacterium sediminicola]
MRLTLATALTGCLILGSLPSHADTAQLPAFKATYTTAFDMGISLSGEAVRQLRQTEGGEWRFSSEAAALMAGISEVTRFQYQPSEPIKPLSYRYHRKVLGKSRKASVEFDWNTLSVTTVVKDKPWKMQVPTGTQDKLSYQLQMRLDLLAGKTEMIYDVADGGKLKEYRFKVTGEEEIDTPYGRFNAVRVMRDRGEGADRETLIWLAPELDYLIIRLEQTESDGKTYALLLKNLETP